MACRKCTKVSVGGVESAQLIATRWEQAQAKFFGLNEVRNYMAQKTHQFGLQAKTSEYDFISK